MYQAKADWQNEYAFMWIKEQRKEASSEAAEIKELIAG